MKLIIVRHGRSQADILNVHEGRADFSLTDTGIKEAEALSEYLKANFKIDKIYSSPLKRAAKTAETIAKALSKDVIFDDRLMEFQNGLLAGLTFEEAADRFPEKKIDEEQAFYCMESKADFRRRAEEVLNFIINENSENGTVAVVTHGGMINQLYRAFFNLPIIGNEFFETGDTGVHILEVLPNRKRVCCSNMTKHLSDEIISEIKEESRMKVAYFAGGCFWCMTPMFKIYGAKKVVCGYSGGDTVNPKYEDVKQQKTGHRETMAVEYDPAKVKYETLLDIYLANVDPYDEGGQYIDRGHSYTLAVYYSNEEEKKIVETKIDKLRAESEKEVYISVEKFKNFYEAEEYHQDYYLKNPEAFEKELVESGRRK